MTRDEEHFTDTDRRQLRQAAELVIATQFPSASYLQRKMRVGYARATYLLDELEHLGVIGPPQGTKQREMREGPAALPRILARLTEEPKP